MKIYKTNTVSVLALVLSGAFAVPLTASAQEQAPPDNAELSGNGEITVTARRVNERLVDVPASISVLTSDTLSNTGAKIAADFVQLTCPLTAETRGLFGADQFAAMKPTAFFITTARGPVHDEAALLDALQGGRLGGAGLDVIHGEWDADLANHPLIRYAREHDNLLISPHLGGITYESQRMAYEFTVLKLKQHLESLQS